MSVRTKRPALAVLPVVLVAIIGVITAAISPTSLGIAAEEAWQPISVFVTLIALSLAIIMLIGQRRRMRARLDSVAEECRLIGQGNFERRLPLSGKSDKFDQISSSVNDMLERLHKLFSALDEQSVHIQHEYGNAAARMGIYLAQAQEGLSPSTPVAIVEAIISLQRERRTLQSSTDAILALSRARRGFVQMRDEDLSLAASEIADILESSAEEKSTLLELQANAAPVRGDSRMLMMMTSNLVDNAIKYSPAGGRIRISTGVSGGQCTLLVEDSGPGIPPDMREAIFEPGQRLDATAHERGSGFGLALVRAIVVQHGGSITIATSPLGGSAFEVRIPLRA